jgi:hypothetical protein
MTAPTVNDVMQRHYIGNGQSQWPTQGGSITIDSATLRQALEESYDPLMPDWPSLVELEEA